MTITTLGTLTGNGSTTAVNWFGKGRGFGTIFPRGVLDGATLTIEVSSDGGSNFILASGSALTTIETKTLQILAGDNLNPVLMKATIAGAGGSTDVTIDIANEVPIDG